MKGPAADYAAELNAEQLAVVEKGDGPCLVLAGAGSGKTRTIVYRVAWLLEHGVAPENVLLLTFTNKAAKEMIGRVRRLANLEEVGLWGGTFHHVCHRILRESGKRIGLKPGFTIIDAEDAKTLMRQCLRDCRVDTKDRRFPSPAVLVSIASYAANVRRTVEDVLHERHPSFLVNLETINRVVGRYRQKKAESGALDFDDLLSETLRLLQGDVEARERYARRFRYVLVDEYQDSNPVQAELVALLGSVHGNILAVGDDAQSIYSFRGADVANILNFPKRFPGAQVFRLETNYRSTPEILDLANDVISHNRRQFPKELRAVRPPSEKPEVLACLSAAQEAKRIADRIEALIDAGTRPTEIAALFRAAHHSQALEFELMKRGIAYDYRGGTRFFERAHVKDALAYLRTVVNKDDAAAWDRVLTLQVGIGDVAASRIYERVRSVDEPDESVAEGLPARAAAGWRTFFGTWRQVRAAQKPSAMIRAVLASDYQLYLENEYPDWKDRIEDLETLADFAERYTDLDAFLADAALDDRLSSGKQGLVTSDDLGKVILSTVHQAKGLEWDAVFVIHLAQGQFPNQRALAEGEGLEEERRLLYVAVTRARNELQLSYPRSLAYGDGFDSESRSMFLEEMDSRLYQKAGLEETWDDLPEIVVDSDGEMIRPRKGLLRDIDEY